MIGYGTVYKGTGAYNANSKTLWSAKVVVWEEE